MTMEILGEVSVGADTMIKLPENASMTMQILDEVKDNERVPVRGLPTTYFLLIPFSREYVFDLICLGDKQMKYIGLGRAL